MNDHVAIVTGASQGIGKATAIRLAKDFSSVALVARNAEALADTAGRVRDAGAKPLVMPLDLREADAAEKVVARTIAEFGRIDALVNIAGAVPQIDLLEMTDAQWDDGLALKLHGARRLRPSKLGTHSRTPGAPLSSPPEIRPQAPKSPFAAVATINAAIVALAKAFAERGIKDG